VYVSEITNAQGERERRIFTTCFDSRRIAVWDPERGRLETEIVTGRGPHAMAFDIGEDHAYAYVGHFLDSYVGVVDLDQRHGDQYGAMIATIAKPEPPRASK
jgi:6-phosphogluconolactonase (cycloisomerase 2 family)